MLGNLGLVPKADERLVWEKRSRDPRTGKEEKGRVEHQGKDLTSYEGEKLPKKEDLKRGVGNIFSENPYKGN